MKIGKLLTIGESAGVVIPRQYLRDLGWIKGDHLVQEIRGKELIIRNAATHTVTTRRQRRDYGDAGADAAE